MASTSSGRPGRPAAASPEDVVALARRRFQAGERVDLQAIARELGLARATVHRWFGTREALLGEMLAQLAEGRLRRIRAQVGGQGPEALLECCDRFNRELAAHAGLAALLASERERALRILTSSGGVLQPRVAAAVARLLDDEAAAGAYEPAIATDTLAYAIVRLAEAFLYNDAMVGIRGDTERLREIEAALLGVRVRAVV